MNIVQHLLTTCTQIIYTIIAIQGILTTDISDQLPIFHIQTKQTVTTHKYITKHLVTQD